MDDAEKLEIAIKARIMAEFAAAETSERDARIEELVKFLFSLSNMVDYDSQWVDVPKDIQETFSAWVEEQKQQSWTGMEQKGWFNYRGEFLAWYIKFRAVVPEIEALNGKQG